MSPSWARHLPPERVANRRIRASPLAPRRVYSSEPQGGFADVRGGSRPCLLRSSAIVLNVRTITGTEATELFITGSPDPGKPLAEQAASMFSAIRDVLRARGASILQERLFATDAAIASILSVRAGIYGDLDDGVPPVLLAVPEGPFGALSGIQVHAVAARSRPQVVRAAGRPCGRSIPGSAGLYVTLLGLVAPEAGSSADQAKAVFEKADAALRSVGGSFFSVARTWLWLKDILRWYGDLNRVRNRFFQERGLLNGRPDQNRLPASTGIGVGPAGRPNCALDLVAIVGAEDAIELYRAAGRQQCAYEYGSAFSRTARAPTPAGTTVYVSGTAAIDASGATCHVGNIRGQIDMTVENARAAMRDSGCTDRDVVYAFAYSKTAEVERAFRQDYRLLGWPCVSVISDVCRDDLLFEIEVCACPGARSV